MGSSGANGLGKLDYQGPVHRKMVKFDPGLSQILSMVFCLRTCNLSLQNTVEPLLQDTVMIMQNFTSSYV